MTISDKIRVYELSRDLNLDNKDILDAAQKLSISVKSHSSSISLEDAKKIKNLINKKNPNEKILSVNKSASKIKNDNRTPIENSKNINTNSLPQEPNQDQFPKESLNKKPLLMRPVTKPNNSQSNSNKKIPSKIENSKKPLIITNSKSQKTLRVEDKNINSPRTTIKNTHGKKPNTSQSNSNIKSPARPPIQLIEKPKNLINSSKNQNFNKKNNSLNQKTQSSNKPYQNSPNNNRKNTPELVGAPIRRQDPKNNSTKPNLNNRQNLRAGDTLNKSARPNSNRPLNSTGSPYRQSSPNKPGGPYKKGGGPTRPTMQNRTGAPNRPGGSYRQQGSPNRQGDAYKQGNINRGGSRFDNQKPTGIRKPVAPSELMQLQKTNAKDQEKSHKINSGLENKENVKQKVKAPNNRPNTSPGSKKSPHRSFSNTSKKPGKTDWDDSAKLEALRSKNPQKQRQKVHIIGENDDSLTSETSGYSGEKISILSASLARPKKEKSDQSQNPKISKQLKKKKKKRLDKDKKKSYGTKSCKRC